MWPRIGIILHKPGIATDQTPCDLFPKPEATNSPFLTPQTYNYSDHTSLPQSSRSGRGGKGGRSWQEWRCGFLEDRCFGETYLWKGDTWNNMKKNHGRSYPPSFSRHRCEGSGRARECAAGAGPAIYGYGTTQQLGFKAIPGCSGQLGISPNPLSLSLCIGTSAPSTIRHTVEPEGGAHAVGDLLPPLRLV